MNKYFLLLFMSILIFSCDKSRYKIQKNQSKQIVIDSNLSQDTTYLNFIKPFKKIVETKVNRIIGYSPEDLTRENGGLESKLGNLYADICYDRIQPLFKQQTGQRLDMSLFNYGGIRAMIPKGDISIKHLFNLMPFENELVVVKLSGAKMYELISYLAESNKAHPISHAKLVLQNGRIIDPIINGKIFDKKRNYYILTSDYLQHGGDNMNFFKNPIHLFSMHIKVRDALIQSIEKTDTIRVKLDGRFIAK